MATRGLLIFKYKGIYYVIYNHNDSYPSFMGVNNAKSIKELCKKFNGNIALARAYLGKILEGIIFIVEARDALENEGDYNVVLEKSSHGFDTEQMSLPNTVVRLDDDPSTSPPISNCFIQYMWEIDIDGCRFGVGRRTMFHYWSWKALYLLPLEEFEKEAEFQYTWSTDICTHFEQTYKAIMIQAAVRRFLAMRRAYHPPNGFLYLKAKKDFDAHSSSSI